MSKPTSLSFPVFSFRHLENPLIGNGYRDYFAYVDINQLPDFEGWRKINVRDPKLSGAVPDAIREGLRDFPQMFHFMNRGIVIAADSAEYDNKSKILTLHLKDPNLHGLLDGGHTYNILREQTGAGGVHPHVKLEIIEGFGREELTPVVDARNTSNQVRDESLMNLQGAFGALKETLRDKPYFKDIAFKEYEIGEDENPKQIDVREIVAILTAFDKESFDAISHPIKAYSSKVACLNHFRDHRGSYDKLYPIADDLLRLYDHISLNLPELYNTARGKADDVSGGKFGKLTGVTVYKGNRSAHLHFINQNTKYGVPAGFVFPILGAFRALLVDKGDRYGWAAGVDPISLLKSELGLTLANVIGNFALEAQNPSKTGKSANVWQSCYVMAENVFLRSTR